MNDKSVAYLQLRPPSFVNSCSPVQLYAAIVDMHRWAIAMAKTLIAYDVDLEGLEIGPLPPPSVVLDWPIQRMELFRKDFASFRESVDQVHRVIDSDYTAKDALQAQLTLVQAAAAGLVKVGWTEQQMAEAISHACSGNRLARTLQSVFGQQG